MNLDVNGEVGCLWGFYPWQNTLFRDPWYTNTKNSVNVANAVGYIPIIGSIVGLVRTILASCLLIKFYKEASSREPEPSIIYATILGIQIVAKTPENEARQQLPEQMKQERNQYISQICRGIIELTSCGIVLSIPDVIITIKRNRISDARLASWE